MLKAMNGAHGEKLPGCLDEFNWRRAYPSDYFDDLLAGISRDSIFFLAREE